MHDKSLKLKKALIDMSINLHTMEGENSFTIYQFPKRKVVIVQVQEWTSEMNSISVIFPKLVSGGVTPTGPAIREAIFQFGFEQLRGSLYNEEENSEDWG